MKEDQLTIVLEDGTEEIVDILFTHEANNKLYVVFELSNKEEVSAAIYVPGETEDEGILEEIETEEEWAMLDRELEAFYQELDEELEEEDDVLDV